MKDRGRETEVALHPVSGHRTPDQLTKDAAGPIGKPDLDVKAGQGKGRRGANVANGDTDLSPHGTPSQPE